jgi:hypothetical protein
MRPGYPRDEDVVIEDDVVEEDAYEIGVNSRK